MTVSLTQSDVWGPYLGRCVVVGSESLDVGNPAIGEVFANVHTASPADVREAVAVAADAFPAWSATTAEQRVAVLRELADCLEAHEEELADWARRSGWRAARTAASPSGS